MTVSKGITAESVLHLEKNGESQFVVAEKLPPSWITCPPFYMYLGATLLHLMDGECTLQLDVRPELMNSKGDLHGGAITAGFDIALSQAVRSSYPRTVNLSTISLTINYICLTCFCDHILNKINMLF